MVILHFSPYSNLYMILRYDKSFKTKIKENYHCLNAFINNLWNSWCVVNMLIYLFEKGI
jgi:hypothetical protein